MRVLDFAAMNTAVILAAEARTGVDDALAAARSFIEGAERRFSRFLPESELSALNASAGDWQDISKDLLEILLACAAFHGETDGLFDPAILPALKNAGYDKSMVEIRATGVSPRSGVPQPPRSRFGEIKIDSTRQRVRLAPGMQIDLGGIAKGWIVERAARLLAEWSMPCAVSAGGDMVFRGYPTDGRAWRVNIEDPLDPERAILGLRLGPCAVATSSVTKRTWVQAGHLRHHLIDPRTGEPAAGNGLSVTVVADSLVTAEVYAKALLIGGQQEYSGRASQRPDLSYYVVGSDGRITTGPAEIEQLPSLAPIHFEYAAPHV